MKRGMKRGGDTMKTTKEKMLDAAITLFQTKGFDGTSVRDIAAKANVNIALVSYYFGGKKGLYEKLITQFFEGYLHVMNEAIIKHYHSEKDRLLSVMRALLQYQTANHSVARMAHREMTLDSTVVRELMTIYSRKEKHDFEVIIRAGMEAGEFEKRPLDYVVIHLRTMITMPYLNPHYLYEIFQITPSDLNFIDRYMKHLEHWVTVWLCQKAEPIQACGEESGTFANSSSTPLINAFT